MKLRWRQHEMLFVTMLAVWEMAVLLLNKTDFNQVSTEYAAAFSKNGFSFIYWKNVLVPQLSSVAIMYLLYLSVTLLILPYIKKISFSDFEKLFTLNILRPIVLIISVSYLLAIGTNCISYYAKPHLFSYGNYQFLSLFGYNDKPLANLFFGFGRSVGLVLLVVFLTGLRELIIWLINKPHKKKKYRVLIINNITTLIFIYLLILVIINPVHDTFKVYVAFITPIFFLYIYLTFWLFPFKAENSLMHRPVFIRLFTATFVGTLPFIINFIFWDSDTGFHFLLYWAFLLFVVTPLSLLLFKQRKDNILQLRGIETALAKSTADLQFLRSQINPHFLFNALNTLYGTALKENAGQAAEGIQKLGDMMRFMLHENNQYWIPMTKEIEYLKNYLDLQMLRTSAGSDMAIEHNLDEVLCSSPIAPMLLIPFVENAFKHGISVREKSWIVIKLNCTDAVIHFEVRNSLHVQNRSDTETDKSGIGLINVRERLQLIYPGKYELQVTEHTKEFSIKLTIQAN
jgi:two-component system, LytTR family, sensor kinase